MMRYFILGLALMSPAAFAAGAPSEVEMLEAVRNNSVVIEFLQQNTENINSQLKFVKAPNTLQMCTRMASQNNCSMSFRILDLNGSTLVSGAIHYNAMKDKYSVFRIMNGAPGAGSDFEDFAKIR